MPPFSHTWLPYIYLYGVGGIFFIIGLIITKKAGSMNLSNKRHLYWFKMLIFGFVYYMALHFLLTIAALYW
ncbi:MAG TPA: hypothetical protein PK073_04970 [Ignavibacteriaceae bacterium]|jgi:hypothetical protein|nr:MAG: hypothetical protein B6D44_07495 [Ignavibacteriales bacterium UTCHB2]HQF42247.1 hypothetical protein [Ignavibacteriaceae bacterium]HQI40167.1 hypothetical protein [Ignavibacteriaceae bacterium]HQJ47303.1 hypothetical protein [Ignavibacteriaceae bacterium]